MDVGAMGCCESPSRVVDCQRCLQIVGAQGSHSVHPSNQGCKASVGQLAANVRSQVKADRKSMQPSGLQAPSVMYRAALLELAACCRHVLHR